MKKETERKLKSGLTAAKDGFQFAKDLVDLWAALENHPAWYGCFGHSSLINANFGEREKLKSRLIEVVTGTSTLGNTTYGPSEWKSPRDALITLHLTNPIAKVNRGVNTGALEADPVEEAAGILLNQLRGVATTTVGYQVRDARRYVSAARVGTAWYSLIRRTVGLMDLADPYDQDAYWKYAVMSSGLRTAKYSALLSDLPYVKAQLDTVTDVFKSLIPLNITLNERTKWLFANVFRDSPTVKFSTKIFVPDMFKYKDSDDKLHIWVFGASAPQFVPSETPTTEQLAASYVIKNMTSFKDVVDGFRDFLNLVKNDDMHSRLAGDLLKAFGQNIFMPIPGYSGGKTPFVYDEDVLNQIQSAVVYVQANHAYNSSVLRLRGVDHLDENEKVVIVNEFTSPPFWTEKLITTYRPEVSAERVLTLTRLVSECSWTNGGTNVSVGDFTAVGTEAVAAYEYADVGPDAESLSYVWASPAYWSMDDYAPAMLPANGATQPMIDAQNWAFVDHAALANYHQVAALSMYVIPFVVDKQTTFQFETMS